jgi:hypothetical protein
MNFLEALAEGFFRTFGITEPHPTLRRRAAWFVLILIVVSAIGIAGVGLLVFHLMHA